MDKTKWGIVADLVRTLSYTDLKLNDTEREDAHNDLANIMDYMITQNCGFKKALQLYRTEDENNAEWIEQAIELLN